MSLDQAVNQRLIINDKSANKTEVSPSPSSSSFSNRSRNPSNTTTSKSPSPISFLTDGGTGGGLSPGSASATSFSLTTTSCQRSSLVSSSTGAASTATVKSSSSPTRSRTIKFNDSCQTSDGANIPTRTNDSDAMSNHQNSTTTTSSNSNTPTSAKPPSSPVKFSSKSKSRHSSTSESTCVTPTGGGGGSGAGTPTGIPGLGPGPDVHSIRVTRKIFNNWRSACGRTKDKTKDFIRRWKTLPENQTEAEISESEHAHHHHNSPQGSTGNVHSPFGTGGPGISSSMDQSGGFAGSMGKDASSSSGEAGGKPSGFGKIRSLTKKFSQDIASEDLSSSAIPSKPSAGWSVHVWATYVQRGGMDDEDALSTKEEEKPGRDLLTDFQKTKLTHFFRHVLDMNHDDVISAADFVALNQRIRHYIEWSPECIEFHVLKEVHSGFLECFLNQPLDDCSVMYYCSSEKETRDHVNLDEWLDVWGKLLEKARALDDLPLWLQYFPKIIFQVINKSGSQKISKEELRAFYTMFLGIDFRVVNETLDSIYNAMTDNGKNPITYRLFKLCFANFLLGRYPHGPGQFLFGICSPQSLHCNFPIDYSAMNTPADDLEPYDPNRDKDHSRRSVIV